MPQTTSISPLATLRRTESGRRTSRTVRNASSRSPCTSWPRDVYTLATHLGVDVSAGGPDAIVFSLNDVPELAGQNPDREPLGGRGRPAIFSTIVVTANLRRVPLVWPARHGS